MSDRAREKEREESLPICDLIGTWQTGGDLPGSRRRREGGLAHTAGLAVNELNPK